MTAPGGDPILSVFVVVVVVDILMRKSKVVLIKSPSIDAFSFLFLVSREYPL